MWNWKSHGLICQLILAYCKYVCISKQKKEKIPQTCWKLPQFVHQRLFKTVFWFLFSSVTVNWISLWTVDFVWGRHVGLFETLINIFVLRYSCNEHLTTIINRLVLKKISCCLKLNTAWIQFKIHVCTLLRRTNGMWSHLQQRLSARNPLLFMSPPIR